MSRTVSRRLSIGLAIAGLQICILLIILACASKGVIIDFGALSFGGMIYVALFTLGFGGPWYQAGTKSPVNYGGNALMGFAFVFICIASVLAIILLYSIAAKKFLPKTNMILSIILSFLLLSSTIVVCASKTIALNIIGNNMLSNYMHLSANTIVYIVFGFIAAVSYITIAAIPFIRQKATK